MYDGTIIVFYTRLGMDGDAYYTRKCNYGLNAQVSCIFYRYVIANLTSLRLAMHCQTSASSTTQLE